MASNCCNDRSYICKRHEKSCNEPFTHGNGGGRHEPSAFRFLTQAPRWGPAVLLLMLATFMLPRRSLVDRLAGTWLVAR